jgi:hypothetical protein
LGDRLGQEFQPLRGQLDLLHENAGYIAAGPGEARNIATCDRIVIDSDHDDRHGTRRHHRRFEHHLRPGGVDCTDSTTHELRCHCERAISIGAVELHIVDPQVAALVAEHTQLLDERSITGSGRGSLKHAEAKDFPRLTGRSGREVRRHCRAGEQRKDASPLHSMTSSVRARTDGGMVRPSSRAVLRLTTNSNRVDCSTGRSAGLAPF